MPYGQFSHVLFVSLDRSLALKTISAQMAEHGLDADAVATAIGGSDGTGSVDVVQLKAGLGALGLRVNDQQVVAIARKYDATGCGLRKIAVTSARWTMLAQIPAGL